MKYKGVKKAILALSMMGFLCGCASGNDTSGQQGSQGNLIVYFSLYGNAEESEDVDVSTSASIVQDDEDLYGTTEYVARLIQNEVGGTLHKIEVEDVYPSDYDTLVDQNHEEMDQEVYPTLKESSLNMDDYDTVFIGYPIWATDVPMAVRSFIEAYDLSDKTVIPFCTHGGYGAGSSFETIAQEAGVETLEGLAIEDEEIDNAQEDVDAWLDEIGVEKQEETAISIQIGDQELEGVLYDTALAQEIAAEFPLSVDMSGYGNREYYGSIDFTPSTEEDGQLSFENGDVTYCPENNTLAIFYSQSDQPDLTMEVIPIGRVNSNLDIFNSLDAQESITFSVKS